MSGASERANGRASGPVLPSLFLVVLNHRVHAFVFDEIGDGERGGTTNARHAMQQCPTTAILNFFDFVRHGVEVVVETSPRIVL